MRLRLLWPVIVLALILLFNYFFTPRFFQLEVRNGRLYGSLISIVHRGSPVLLLALGMTPVIATAGIDLSVGAVMAIAGAVAAILIARPEYSWLSRLDVHGSIALVILIALATGMLAGVWNGVLVAFRDIQPIVATLILMVSGRGVAQLLTNGQVPTFHSKPFEFLWSGTLFGLPFTFTLVAGMALLAGLLTRATALGLLLESVGNNPRASRYSGVNARLVKMVAYTFCGLCAALAGLLVTADIRAADANNAGLYLELDAILAVSIGGTALTGGRFSLLGSLIGALVIQSLTTTILARNIQREVDLMIKAGVVIVVCLLQSQTFRDAISRRFRRTAR